MACAKDMQPGCNDLNGQAWRLAVIGTLLVGLVLGIYRWYQ